MRKFLLIACAILMSAVTADAKVKFGIRGGVNITDMSFSSDVFEGKNRNGFYLGPTIKIGLPLGFDIDASAIYNQWEADPDLYYTVDDTSNSIKASNLKRKVIALPLNLRKGFGLGDKASIFLFAGPQVAFNIGDKTIKEMDEVNWEWKTTDISINIGVGAMLLNHLEVKANYNIPCGKTGEFRFSDAADNVYETLEAKTGGWQIGLAVYF